MFTLEQITTAHSKVKSGADFPSYIRELKTFGVKAYDIYVEDGQAVYSDKDNNTISSSSKYETKHIHPEVHHEQFILDLKRHQKGESNYMEFIEDCAKSGIVKWTVDLEKMTCTYFDIHNSEILTESIPS